VVVGNIGSDRRAKYGVVGPPVNIAGRIESYTVGGQVLVSEATISEAGEHVVVGERMEILAKGAKAPVGVYPLKGLGTPEAGLFLPDRRDPLHSLEPPLPVRCWKLEGKHVAGDTFDGKIGRLSKDEAEMKTDGSLEALSNLKLRLLTADGGEQDGDIYVKVTKVMAEGRVELRFTAVPPEIEAQLKARLTAAKGI
jgi:adenylate cyclase